MLHTISPVDQSIVVETVAATTDSVTQILSNAQKAQLPWSQLKLSERKAQVSKLVDLIESQAEQLGRDIAVQMGRPNKFTKGEVSTAVLRSRTMLDYADKALARVDVDTESAPQFTKYLTKEPLGVVLVMSPWNYPWLCLVNGLIPALVAGNAVVIKPSPQTPKVADAVVELAQKAGLAEGLVSVVHSGDNELLSSLIANPIIQGVSFTGSVAGGLAVQQAAAHRTIPIALELGGNDATYVRKDVKDIKDTAANVADGAFFNTGQSCCSIERCYVHESIYDEFVKELTDVASAYKVGTPDQDVDIGPLISVASADRVRKDIKDAVAAGAKLLTPERDLSSLGPAFVAPAVLVDVPAFANLLADETFGPVLPVVKVSSDQEAIGLINDSQYGLTASVWTSNEDEGEEIANQLEAGTVFVNRCDYPDPYLAWTGYKLSGRGVSLGPYGFDHWVKVKSHHIKRLS